MLGDIVSYDTFVWQITQAIEFRIFQDAKTLNYATKQSAHVLSSVSFISLKIVQHIVASQPHSIAGRPIESIDCDKCTGSKTRGHN